MPSTVVSRSALIQRLRPNTSGTTATLVRVKMAEAWPAIRIISTRSQYPLTTVNIHVATPITMRLPAMYGRPPAHPALGPVAQPPGHRVGEPADQAVGGQGEGDGQGARGPLLHEEGDQDPGHGQVGPWADQPDGQADEAADPGGCRCRPANRWTGSRTRSGRTAPAR